LKAKDKAMLTEIDEETARRFLGENNVARLGCVLESGEPYIVPINYFYRDGAIYFHSTEGLKLAALRSNPKACVQVDETKNYFEWRSVIAFGEFEEIKDQSKREEIRQTLLKVFEKLTPAEAVRQGVDAPGEIVLFRVNVRRVTGKAEN
jgi:nitroimidazol reductase NimA-like FMN-containing flavoprotein (pyridoxamine 5'-phosphate oxidase superfamily)